MRSRDCDIRSDHRVEKIVVLWPKQSAKRELQIFLFNLALNEIYTPSRGAITRRLYIRRDKTM